MLKKHIINVENSNADTFFHDSLMNRENRNRNSVHPCWKVCLCKHLSFFTTWLACLWQVFLDWHSQYSSIPDWKYAYCARFIDKIYCSNTKSSRYTLFQTQPSCNHRAQWPPVGSSQNWPLTSHPPTEHQNPVVELCSYSLMSQSRSWLLLLKSPVTHMNESAQVCLIVHFRMTCRKTAWSCLCHH